LARKFKFEYDNIKVDKPPYIVVSNHLTNWDPLLIGLSFGKNMYYVATDQIFRMGLKSKLLMYFFSPIARAKTAQETQTVITIFRRLKDNCNICIFAEGSTSYDGQTGEIQPSIGKLVKRAGVTLVTYRFTGSYFTFPRWARFIRKGRMEGRLVQIYSPEKIASMTETEIYEAVKNDIYVSAYSDQEKNPVAFHGKKPAEYLETILYCCPNCKQFSTLKSHDDILSCTCGFKVRYNKFGYFETEGNDHPPTCKTITDWVNWQRKEIDALAASINNLDGNTPIFTDENQKLIQVEKTYASVFIAKGKLSLYKDRLSLTSESGETVEFPIKTIIDMSGFAMMTIIFSTNENKIFEIHSEYPRSALKYLDMYKAMKTFTKE
jgi:1-acyl-sn-glycerol-3-phosphate acyltransferase